MGFFRFHEHPTSINLTRLVHEEPRLSALRDKLSEHFATMEHGPGARERARTRAQDALESLVHAALHDYGDGFIGKKGAALDRIVALRAELAEAFASVVSSAKKLESLPKPAEIAGKLRELEAILANVRERADGVIGKDLEHGTLDEHARKLVDELTPKKKPKASGTPIPAGTKKRLQDSGFKVKGNVARKKYKSGKVEIRLVDGKYRVTAFDNAGNATHFGEFETLDKPYREKPLSSRVMQAHHGCQRALMDFLFEPYGYAGGEAPTVWLRDSTGDSPHGVITHEIQNPNYQQRLKGLTYAKIREYAVLDLQRAGATPDQIARFLAAHDRYFRTHIEPKIPAHLRPTLVGDVPWLSK